MYAYRVKLPYITNKPIIYVTYEDSPDSYWLKHKVEEAFGKLATLETISKNDFNLIAYSGANIIIDGLEDPKRPEPPVEEVLATESTTPDEPVL